MTKPIREYSNDEITVQWRPELCLHCGNCINSLPQVFDLNKKPWVNISGASTEEVIETVNQCPDGALRVRIDRVKIL